MRRLRGGCRDEAGAATVFALAALALVLVVGLAGSVVGGVVLAHRRAGAAADLAALAAAQGAQAGRDPCAQADRVAAANGANLTGCSVDGWDATVEVRVSGPRVFGRSATLPARARAGPGWPSGSPR